MNTEQFKAKYFLTGFMLISALVILVTMLFVTIFGISIVSSFGNVIISFISVLAVVGSYFYAIHKFDYAQKFSHLAFFYVLSICLLGLLMWTVTYLVIVAGLLIPFLDIAILTIVVEIMVLYFTMSELFAVLAVFSLAFSLRELEKDNFKFNYALGVLVSIIIIFVINGFEFNSISAFLVTSLFSIISTFYIYFGVKYGPIGMDYESIESRYAFIIKVVTHAVMAPIQMPLCMYKQIKIKLFRR